MQQGCRDYNRIIKFNLGTRLIIISLAAVGVALQMEMIMEKIFDTSPDELIDLGAVTEETRGSVAGLDDQQGGQRIQLGLTDD